jgi:Flp pilus assembly protein TadD
MASMPSPPTLLTIAATLAAMIIPVVCWWFYTRQQQRRGKNIPGFKFEGPRKEDVCAICLSPPTEPVSVTTCGHTFCSACMAELRKRAYQGQLNDACPICRVPLEATAEKSYMEAILTVARTNRVYELHEVDGASVNSLVGTSGIPVDGTMEFVRRALERALRLDKNHLGALIALSEMIVAENPKRAERLVRSAIGIDDSFASAHVGLGKALQRLNRLPDAIAAYERGIAVAQRERNTSDVLSYAWMSLAMAQGQHGNLDASITAYKKAATADPTNFLIPFNMGVSLEETNVDGAIAAYKQSFALNRHFYPTNFALATAYTLRLIANAHDNSRPGQLQRGDDAQRWIGAILRAKRLATKNTQVEDCDAVLQQIEEYFPQAWRAYQQVGADFIMGMV